MKRKFFIVNESGQLITCNGKLLICTKPGFFGYKTLFNLTARTKNFNAEARNKNFVFPGRIKTFDVESRTKPFNVLDRTKTFELVNR